MITSRAVGAGMPAASTRRIVVGSFLSVCFVAWLIDASYSKAVCSLQKVIGNCLGLPETPRYNSTTFNPLHRLWAPHCTVLQRDRPTNKWTDGRHHDANVYQCNRIKIRLYVRDPSSTAKQEIPPARGILLRRTKNHGVIVRFRRGRKFIVLVVGGRAAS